MILSLYDLIFENLLFRKLYHLLGGLAGALLGAGLLIWDHLFFRRIACPFAALGGR